MYKQKFLGNDYVKYRAPLQLMMTYVMIRNYLDYLYLKDVFFSKSKCYCILHIKVNQLN